MEADIIETLPARSPALGTTPVDAVIEQYLNHYAEAEAQWSELATTCIGSRRALRTCFGDSGLCRERGFRVRVTERQT